MMVSARRREVFDLSFGPGFTIFVMWATIGSLKWAENLLCFAVWPMVVLAFLLFVLFDTIASKDTTLRDAMAFPAKSFWPKWVISCFWVLNVALAASEGWYITSAVMLLILLFTFGIRSKSKFLRDGNLNAGV